MEDLPTQKIIGIYSKKHREKISRQLNTHRDRVKNKTSREASSKSRMLGIGNYKLPMRHTRCLEFKTPVACAMRHE
uniref:Uncharacterized protein n=1 Tax=Cucumis melo TaxID=3656 RepID=A0A9I9CKJ7_CUCME